MPASCQTRNRTGLIAALSAAFFCSGISEGFAQQRELTFTTSAAALDINTEVVKRLAAVEDHVKERQWEQAVLILDKVEADHGDELIAVDKRRFVNVATYCKSVLANFPPEGLAAYREKHDAQAKKWLEDGLRSRNPADLERIIENAFISRPADEALFILGEWAWDRGELALARDYWRKLLRRGDPPEIGQPLEVLRYPDSQFAQAEIIARVALTHLLEGNRPLADSWSAYLAKNHAIAEGKLAGRQGVLAEILKDIFKASGDWRLPRDQSDTLTFAGNARRNARYAKRPSLNAVQWNVPLPEFGNAPTSPRIGQEETPLSVFPVVADNTVFFCDADQIYALDLLTGHARWNLFGKGEIRTREDLKSAVIYQSAILSSETGQHRVGVPRFSLTIHENRLFARMGAPVTGQLSKTSASTNSHLVCLDLDKDAKMVWYVEPDPLLAGTKYESSRRWAFEGTPVASRGRVFVALRRTHPQTESLVACLEEATGKLLWITNAANAVSTIGAGQVFLSHQLLTLGENMVFFVPEFGVVLAMEAHSGRVMWAVTYPSVSPKDSPILKDPRKQGLTPCLFHEGVVFAAPGDSQSILAISAKTGVILWEQTIPFEHDAIHHLLGVADNKLVLTGHDLWILNAETGAIEFPAHPAPGRHEQFDIHGRGLIAEEAIYLPTRSAIEIRDLAGKKLDQPKPQAGGNLLLAGETLLIAGSHRLAAFGNLAKVKETQRRLLSQSPDQALPYWRLAQAESATGDWEAALEMNRQVLKRASKNDLVDGRSLQELAKENQSRLLIQLGRQQLKNSQPDRAADSLKEAIATAKDPVLQGEAYLWLGRSLSRTRDHDRAVETYQSVLQNRAVAEALEPESKQAFGEIARKEIDALIAKVGRSVYGAYDREAEQLLQDQFAAGDLAAVRETLQTFPNSQFIPAGKYRLGELHRSQGRFHEAITIWDELLEASPTAALQQEILIAKANALEAKNFLRPARQVWRRLLREFPSAEIPRGAETIPVSRFVPSHIKSAKYRWLDRIEIAGPLMRSWETSLPAEAKLLFPDGVSPGPEWDSVLVEAGEVRRRNPADGQVRWTVSLDDPVLWSAYGECHLLVGTQNTLSALRLESGETLWQSSISLDETPPPSTVQFAIMNERILVCSSRELTAWDAWSGRNIWRRRIAGEPSPHWFPGAEMIAIGFDVPLKLVIYETQTGEPITEHRLKSHFVAAPMRFQIGQESGRQKSLTGFVTAGRNKRIQAYAAFDPLGEPNWEYQGAYSAANAPPRFFTPGEDLFVVIDGDTLIKIDARTGKELWAVPMGQHSERLSYKNLIFREDRILLAGREYLICLKNESGKPVWRQSLPFADSWQLRQHGPALIAFADNDLLLFNQTTGEKLQALEFEAVIENVHSLGGEIVVAAQGKLMGLRSHAFLSRAN